MRKMAGLMLGTSMMLMAAPQTALAQNASADDIAALRAEIASLRSQIATLESRVNSVETVPAPAPVAPPVVAAVAKPAKPATEIAWKGAPELKQADGWSFKPRGRIQIDVAGVDAPDAVSPTRLGIGTEFRRVYLGVEGKMPGGFGYRAEADFANSSVELTDVYVNYSKGPLTVTAGQIKPFWSMEEITSDLFTSFMERAAFNSAFGFERRVGLAAAYRKGDVLAQAGVFGDNANDLLNDANNSFSVDGRLVFLPKVGDTQLHFGGSFHRRTFNDTASTTRYQARPFSHITDLRLINTGNITATGEDGMGVEFAAIKGPFHASAEGFWQSVRRPGLPDPTFFGGYAEVGMMLTKGDTSAYKDGVYDRTKPAKPLSAGGPGAVQFNLRYDYLDLNDAGIVGGRQKTLGASIVWTPIEYVRLTANYGHLTFDDAAVSAAGDRDYSANVLGLRTQIDF
ncbi:MAG: Phosphate-selective porin [Pseudomonadota bacterium]